MLRELWDLDRPATAAELHRALSREREIAYTTVSTSLQRMAKKDLVTQDRVGKAHHFAAAAEREEVLSGLISEALGLVGTAPGVLTRFVGQLDPEVEDELRSTLGQTAKRVED